jgi:uncharacterized membrane protein
MLYITAAIALFFALILFSVAFILLKASKEKQAEEKKSEEMEQALSN